MIMLDRLLKYLKYLMRHNKYKRLPLEAWDANLDAVPAMPVPTMLDEWLDTLLKLAGREESSKQAKFALSNTYSIQHHTATAYQFMYGKDTETDILTSRQEHIKVIEDNVKSFQKQIFKEVFHQEHTWSPDMHSDELTTLSLEQPDQWSMGWTTFPDIYHQAQGHLSTWAATLSDVKVANEQFWPTIANYGLVYNLLILQKVNTVQLSHLKAKFGTAWTTDLDDLHQAGALYAIDMSIFASTQKVNVDGVDRFTPSTLTLLQRDPETKRLSPIMVRVAGYQDKEAQVFDLKQCTPSAWLYALQAVKVSITVYGIWLGHVYHWHIVSAAMLMTMYQYLPDWHIVAKLLTPQSNYVIPFDSILLVNWIDIAPPSAISTSHQFLSLLDAFATERNFFDDDPVRALEKFGLKEEDFTRHEAWDQYPVVGHLLTIWQATVEYCGCICRGQLSR